MSRLDVHDLSASVAGQPFLDRLSFSLRAVDLTVLLGPSGGGKTTLLRTLAGFHPQTAGRILVDGRDVATDPPEKRGIVLLHQENALFPHLRVADNIAFGPRLRRRARTETAQQVRDLLRLVDLEGFGSRRITELSGGERQRVALARALAVEPRVLLLDEPLSALDRNLRHALRDDLRRILRERETTALYVTHDHEEAFALADAVLLMAAGRLVDHGDVVRVFREPSSLEAARVIGRSNLFPFQRTSEGNLDTPVGALPIPGAPTERGHVLVPEEDVNLQPHPDGEAVVEAVTFLGAHTRYRLRQGGGTLRAERPGPPVARVGERVAADVRGARVRFYP